MNAPDDAPAPERPPRLSRAWRGWETFLLLCIPVIGIAFLSDVSSYFDYAPWHEQYVVLVFGIGLAAVFLGLPARRQDIGAPATIVDKGLSVLSLVIGVFSALRWPSFAMGHFVMPLDLAVALATVALVLEATRRTVGKVLFGLGLAALVLGLTASWIPQPLSGRDVAWQELIMYLYTDSAGIVGMPLGIASTVVLAFILFGTVLFVSGAGQVFIDLSLALVGRFRGGPAKVAVVASSLFGSISGSAVSNVVTTGSLTIPLMKRTGYTANIAAAVESVASTGGQLLPPVMGAAAFLMADFLGIPYAEVAIAAVVPALMFYLCLFVQVHLEAVKNGIERLQREDVPALRPVLMRVWILVVPLIGLIYVLFFLNWHATKAGLVSAAVAFVVGVVYRRGRVGAREIFDILVETGRRMLDLLVITATAGIIIGSLSVTGTSFTFALHVVDLAAGSLPLLLLLSAVTGIVLGMGMPTAGVYILLAVLAAPALVSLGVNAIAAHLFVLYFGMLSMITPPVCLAVFAAASIAGADNMRSGLAAVRLGGACYLVPFLFVFSPALILQEGSMLEIVRAVTAATAGVVVLGIVLAGYLFRPLGPAERGAFAVCCALLAWPGAGPGVGALAGLTDAIGGVLLVCLVAALWRRARRMASTAV